MAAPSWLGWRWVGGIWLAVAVGLAASRWRISSSAWWLCWPLVSFLGLYPGAGYALVGAGWAGGWSRVVGAALAVSTASRNALGGVAAAAVCAAWRRDWRDLIAWLLGGALGLALGGAVWQMRVAIMTSGTASGAAHASGYRLDLLRDAADVLSGSPWIGAGIGWYYEALVDRGITWLGAGVPHSVPVLIAVSVGVVGGIAALAIIAAAAVLALRAGTLARYVVVLPMVLNEQWMASTFIGWALLGLWVGREWGVRGGTTVVVQSRAEV